MVDSLQDEQLSGITGQEFEYPVIGDTAEVAAGRLSRDQNQSGDFHRIKAIQSMPWAGVAYRAMRCAMNGYALPTSGISIRLCTKFFEESPLLWRWLSSDKVDDFGRRRNARSIGLDEGDARAC